jgi:NTE family protein
MQAYAVMDGGGVKGAALAGCLSAAEDAGIHFVGFGGTSAGSIIALLACVGYSGKELVALMSTELRLGELLSEVKAPLALLKQVPQDVQQFKKRKILSLWMKYGSTGKRLFTQLGLARCDAFETKLLELVRRKLGDDVTADFNFSDLAERGRPPLKVVASDLSRRQPVVFSVATEDVPVLKAVRGSMSYPLMFAPLELGERRIVDGGLCSNLPAFVFDQERANDKRPLIAFDLVSRPKAPANPYGMFDFATDLLETALEAGDFIRVQTRDFYRVVIPISDEIGTLDFDISPFQIEALINAGRAETATFINHALYNWTKAQTRVQRLQALYAPASEIRFLLSQFAQDVENILKLRAGSVRVAVSLPTGWETRIVVYQFNMDNDLDQNLELDMDGGCSGACWTDREPKYVDLADTAADPAMFHVTDAQQAKVRKDRRAMLSVPIFERAPLSDRESPQNPLLGVLSFDTDVPVTTLGWNLQGGDASNFLQDVIALCELWSRIMTKVLR